MKKFPLAQVNLVGANDEIDFRRPQRRAEFRGEVIALGKGFAEEILVADLKSESRIQNPGSGIDFPPREQQIFSALSLGIRDYVRKCGFQIGDYRLVRRH